MDIYEIARRRDLLHKDSKSNRPYTRGSTNLVGLAGEAAFSEYSGLHVDVTPRKEGDSGVDFVWGSLTIDVKTSTHPRPLLLVEEGKVRADVYVLAKYSCMPDKTRPDGHLHSAILLGWCYGTDAENFPTRDMGRGIISHVVPAGDLWDMWLLRRICTGKV